MSHPDFDPVWAQMVELGLAPTFHIGAFAERVIDDGWQANDVIQYMTTQSLVAEWAGRSISLADLILNACIRSSSGAHVDRGRVLRGLAPGALSSGSTSGTTFTIR